MLKVGVVGLGKMGRIHLRNYTEMADVEVVGVVDVAAEAREEVAARFGVAAFATVEELLALGPDAVSVCVPTVLHHDAGSKLLDARVNVLIEKPLAATAGEGEELVRLAAENGVTLMVGHVERFNPAIVRLKELLGDDVVSIQITRVSPYPARIQDVGVIKDLGSHDIDLIRFLSGSDFKSVHGVWSASLGEHEDSALIAAEMENGVLASVTTNWLTPYRERSIAVTCKARRLAANLITQEVREYSAAPGCDNAWTVREWPVMARETIKEELTRFIEAVRGGAAAPITGEDGLKVLQVFDRIFSRAG
ncbi:Gfo/Idh/MocA family oxidoreductase [Pseudodesulfovibrio sp.]|uniref:Gfo/Idh/MocA family protein n=1 Tax=Pseudodesulfovibrio sp. TaxID=2035812 RepID=UPI0026230F07|nr:Gfo/Idh/MocA family oxidoreductase [Pseudodesulfovibrio sp.]MDD3312448.1 Gfo/Idh/MocA family oxidoreductase [Pseudodesulfovibrio sp.]